MNGYDLRPLRLIRNGQMRNSLLTLGFVEQSPYRADVLSSKIHRNVSKHANRVHYSHRHTQCPSRSPLCLISFTRITATALVQVACMESGYHVTAHSHCRSACRFKLQPQLRRTGAHRRASTRQPHCSLRHVCRYLGTGCHCV